MWKHTFILCSSYSISKSKETRHRTQGHTEYTESHSTRGVVRYERCLARAGRNTSECAPLSPREWGCLGLRLSNTRSPLALAEHRSQYYHQHLRSQLILSLHMLSTLFYLFEKDRSIILKLDTLYYILCTHTDACKFNNCVEISIQPWTPNKHFFGSGCY